MSLELKEGAETEGLPTITLDGEPYFVARLPLRSRIGITAVLPKIGEAIKKLPGIDAIQAGATVEFPEDVSLAFVDVIYFGLKPLYPKITREDVLDIPTDLLELMAAIPIIAAQGRSRRIPAGEPQATSLSTNPTGAASSPTS
jgi:hypothetical protein